MITFEWFFNQLLVKPEQSGMHNVLHVVYWTLKGVNEDGVEAAQSGSCSLPDPDPISFTDWGLLSKGDVELFVQNSMGLNTVASLKKSIAEQIEYKVNPPVISMQPPWE